jgi:hypothetical protein
VLYGSRARSAAAVFGALGRERGQGRGRGARQIDRSVGPDLELSLTLFGRYNTGDFPAAQEAAQEALKNSPEDRVLLTVLGYCQRERHQLEDAMNT